MHWDQTEVSPPTRTNRLSCTIFLKLELWTPSVCTVQAYICMYVKIIYTQISCTYIHIYFFLNFLLMAVPFLACVFTHISLNSWPLSCSLYFETNFKKEKKITGKIPLLMQDSESLQPAWSPFFVLSTVSGYWFAIESEEQGVCVFIFKRVLRRREAVSQEQRDCRSTGSLKTCGFHSKSLWLTD